jgi:hypothetical protein
MQLRKRVQSHQRLMKRHARGSLELSFRVRSPGLRLNPMSTQSRRPERSFSFITDGYILQTRLWRRSFMIKSLLEFHRNSNSGKGGKNLLFLFVYKLNKYQLWKLNEPSESRQSSKWVFRDHQVPGISFRYHWEA